MLPARAPRVPRCATVAAVMAVAALVPLAASAQDPPGTPEAPSPPAEAAPPAEPDVCDTAGWKARIDATVPPDERRQAYLELLERTPPLPELRLATPAGVERHMLEPDGAGPSYYGERDPAYHLGVRGAPGVLVALGAGVPRRTAFSFDAAAYGRFGLGRGNPSWTVWPEVGYWLVNRLADDVDDPSDTHAASLGLGFGWQYFNFSTGLQPRLVLGRTGDALTIGVRPTLGVAVGQGLFALDLSYAALWTDGQPSHALVFALGIDLGPIVRSGLERDYEIFD